MVGKIFEILAGIKKTSQITKSASVESVDKIVAEITEQGVAVELTAFQIKEVLLVQ